MEDALEVTQRQDAGAPLKIQKMAGKIGAQVFNVDLRQPLTDEVFAFLQAAVVEHQVIFLRDQDLNEEQHRAVAARFGPLSVYPAQKLAGETSEMSYIADNVDSPPKADDWHTDISWLPEPPKYALIEEIFQPVEHPLVRTHPISGRQALFLSGNFLERIVGLTENESEMLKRYLNSLLDDPNVQVRWKWKQFDFAIWDEASTNHRALSDHYPQERMVRRGTVDGARPFYRPEANSN